MSETMGNTPSSDIGQEPKKWTIFDEKEWHERTANSDLDSTEINPKLSYTTPENIKTVQDLCAEVFGEHMKNIRITNSFWMDLEDFFDALHEWQEEKDPAKKKELLEELENEGQTLKRFFAAQNDGLVPSVRKWAKETNDSRNPDDIWNEMLDNLLKKLVNARIKKKPGAL